MKITMVDLHGQYERIREEINNAIQEVLDTKHGVLLVHLSVSARRGLQRHPRGAAGAE